MRRRLLLLALFAIVLAVCAASVASATRLGYSAVTTDERLIYKYNSALGAQINAAAAQWDWLDCYWSKPDNACAGVDIQNVNQTTSAPTVTISDYCKRNSRIYATTSTRGSGPLGGGTSTMTLNACDINKEKSADRVEIIAHEFGHALGFAHPGSTKAWSKKSLMSNGDLTPFIGPAVYDIYEYYYMWVAP